MTGKESGHLWEHLGPWEREGGQGLVTEGSVGPSSRLPLARLSARYLPLRAVVTQWSLHLLPAQVTCPFLRPSLPGPASFRDPPQGEVGGTFQQALESGVPPAGVARAQGVLTHHPVQRGVAGHVA